MAARTIPNRPLGTVLELGQQLLESKGLLSRQGKGQRLGIDRSQIAEFARIAEIFGGRIGDRPLPIEQGALILLAADNVPEPVRSLALTYAERGAKVTTKLAAAMIATGSEEV